MHIPEEIRKCVVFICWAKHSDDTPRIAGTAFLASMPLDVVRYDRRVPRSLYVITARHVIEEISQKDHNGKIYLRCNFDGKAHFIATDISSWVFHATNHKCDVAVHPFFLRRDFGAAFDHTFLPVESFGSRDLLHHYRAGPGDIVSIIGLFKNHSGRHRNIPIVRTGNVAAMLEEKVSTKRMGEIDAYLIECRSIGGLSGSPVFIEVTKKVVPKRERFAQMIGGRPIARGYRITLPETAYVWHRSRVARGQSGLAAACGRRRRSWRAGRNSS